MDAFRYRGVPLEPTHYTTLCLVAKVWGLGQKCREKEEKNLGQFHLPDRT